MIDPRSGKVRRELELDGPRRCAQSRRSRLTAGRSCCQRQRRRLVRSLPRTRSTRARSSGSPTIRSRISSRPSRPTAAPSCSSTERYTTSLETLEPGPMRLAAIDLATSDRPPDRGVPSRQAREPAGHRRRRLGRVRRRPGRCQQPLSRADRRRAHRAALDRRDGRRGHHVDESDAQCPRRPAGWRSACSKTTATPSTRSTRRTSSRSCRRRRPSARPSCRAARRRPATCSGCSPMRRVDCPRPDAADAAAEPYKGKLMLDEIGQPTIQGTVYEGGGTYVPGRRLGVLQRHARRPRSRHGRTVRRHARRHRRRTALRQPPAPLELVDLRRHLAVLDRLSEPHGHAGCHHRARSDRTADLPVRASGATTFAFNTSTRLEVAGGAQLLSFVSDTRTSVFDPVTHRADECDRGDARATPTRCTSAWAQRRDRAGHVVLRRDRATDGAPLTLRGRAQPGLAEVSDAAARLAALLHARRTGHDRRSRAALRPLRRATATTRGSSGSTPAIRSSCTGTASARSRRQSVHRSAAGRSAPCSTG